MGGKSGGGKGKGGSTPAPNFGQAALQTSQSSRPNTSTPWANQSWTYGPNGQPSMNYQLTGDAGQALTQLQSNMLRAANYDPTQARNEAIQSNYGQGMSRLQPMMDKQNTLFRSQMANSGLDNTEAGRNAADTLSRGQNDAWNSLMANSIAQGNATQQTQMQQMMQPFQQYGSLIGSSMQHPYMGLPADYNKAAMNQYEAAKDATSAGQGGKGGLLSGLGGLAGTMFGGPLGGMAGSSLGGKMGGGKGGSSRTPGQYSAQLLPEGYDPNQGAYL